MAIEGKQGALPVGDIRGDSGNGVRQVLGIDRNVALDSRDFLARVVAFLSGSIAVLDALRVDDQEARRRFAPLSGTGRANHIFFKARSSTLKPHGLGSLHLAKYACTVRHLGKSLGSIRHWQPLLSRYSTPQNTSYKSTVRGFVCLRTLSSNSLISSKASLLMSLGYLFLIPQVYDAHMIVNWFLRISLVDGPLASAFGG